MTVSVTAGSTNAGAETEKSEDPDEQVSSEYNINCTNQLLEDLNFYSYTFDCIQKNKFDLIPEQIVTLPSLVLIFRSRITASLI